MPVPGGRFEAEMLLRLEMAFISPAEADHQEDGTDDNVEAVEAGRHEEGRAIDAVLKVERRMGIFIGLDAGEQHAQQNGAPKALDKPLAVAMDQRMMRPGHRGSRTEQDEGVEQREAERVEHCRALRWPDAADRIHRRGKQ